VAALKGATVYGVDIDENKFDSAVQKGARACFHSLTELSGITLDAVVDFAGVGATTATAFTAVKPTGRVVLVGLGANKFELSAQALVTRNVQLCGSLGSIRDEYITVLDLIATKSIVPVLEEINFADVPKALERLELGEILGRLWTNPNA
jgi:propanol-preferring alcohol dehydrogenase